MNISIAGAGYLGLVTGVCLAKKGHEIICVDKRPEIVRKVNNMICPIYEPKLPELLKEVVEEKRLIATTDMEFAVNNTDITIIALDAPFKENTIDLSYIKSCAHDIGSILEDKENYHVVCVKSTVLPSTTDSIIKDILEQASKKQAGGFGLSMNPEFFREGFAVDDFMNPDRVIIGAYDEKSFDTMAEVYEEYFDAPILKANLRTAEMIKYSSNCLLAALSSIGNEISNICESIGDIDSIDVFNGLIMDRRIAIRNKAKYIIPGLVQYLRPGCGFGGSSIPRDIKALKTYASSNMYQSEVLEPLLKINDAQPYKMIRKLEALLGDVEKKKVAVLGISFMPETDDITESPGIKIIRELLNKGAKVYAVDPQAIHNAKLELGNAEGLKLVKSYKEALREADAAMLITAWNEFKKIKPKEFVKLMKRPVIIDGRRLYDREEMESYEIIYTGIGMDK